MCVRYVGVILVPTLRVGTGVRTLCVLYFAPDAAVAWRAVHTLVVAADKSVPFLQTLLRPVVSPDARRVARLLADLDSDAFEQRRQASAALLQLGELVEPDLRHIRDAKPTLEVRRRVELLLEQIEQQATSPEALRILHVTTVLERIDNTGSRALLRRLAEGAAGARLTREAAAAVQRLTRRHAQP